jgi:RNA polymerase sigma-70 factor (ECF subfamily)
MEGQLVMTDGRVTAAQRYADATKLRVPDAYRLAGYLLGDAVEAQDAVQDALIKAWRSWSTLRNPDSFGPWFDRILVNVCRDRMRRRRTVRLVELEAAGEVESADVFASIFDGSRIAAAVARLSPDRRIVVVLRYWRDMSLEQIAETLKLPLGTVKTRLYGSLRILEADLAEGEK